MSHLCAKLCRAKLCWNSTVIDMSEESKQISDTKLADALAQFGFASFRPGQREAINTLLEHDNVVLIAPTGGGKSLSYQLPALILEGTTVVVSPLIALMQDQVAALQKKGIAATFLNSSLSEEASNKRIDALVRGEFCLLYVSPERLVRARFQQLLKQIKVALIAVDEAHCISQWGHDFRPEYLEIGRIIQRFGFERVLACTATATPVVRDEIVSRLGLPANTPQLVQGFARPNLALSAKEVGGKADLIGNLRQVLSKTLNANPEQTDAEAINGCAIVYAPTRKKVEEYCQEIATWGYRTAGYHAGMNNNVRKSISEAFSAQKIQVVVATNAFGMGIDRSDVRAVVHLAPPSSIEAYYQEVGRAGRDGQNAVGLLMVSAGDVPLRRRLIENDVNGGQVDAEVVEHKWNLFLELMRYVEGGSCRHDAILRYFDDISEVLDGCGRCDNCLRIDDEAFDEEAATTIVRKALSGVARAHAKLGLGAVALLLRGKTDARLERLGLQKTSTFGVLGEHSLDWITRVLRRCVTAAYVELRGDPYAFVHLTEVGQDVMKGKRPPRLLLPAVAVAKVGRGSRSGHKKRTIAEELTGDATLRFEALRNYRLERARQDGVPAFHIASDRTLRDIATLDPKTLAELEGAHGIGPSKLEKYGQEILGALSSVT